MRGFSLTGEKNFIDKNYIEVTGQAELEILPDMIYLKIVLKDKNNKDKLTLPEIEKKMIEKLVEIGIDVNEDLSLVDLVNNLKTIWLKSNVVFTKQYRLIVHDCETLQKAFFVFQNLGISDVLIEKMEHSKMEQHSQEVQVSAVKAAKEKAERLAKVLNQNVGKALYIVEDEYDESKNRYRNFYPISCQSGARIAVNLSKSSLAKHSADFSADSEIAEIEFEKIMFASAILVRFELE